MDWVNIDVPSWDLATPRCWENMMGEERHRHDGSARASSDHRWGMFRRLLGLLAAITAATVAAAEECR